MIDPEPIRIVLDTSVFTNPDTSGQWAEDGASALPVFLEQAMETRGLIECYMPPSIYEELQTFLGEENIPPEMSLVIQLKAPNRYDIKVSGLLLYELIEDIRGRIDRGLRVAEKHVRKSDDDTIDSTIRKLRGEYRSALRAGLLDSKEDVDLILLATELDAAIVSADKGVMTWAEKLGIRLIEPENLKAVFKKALG